MKLRPLVRPADGRSVKPSSRAVVAAATALLAASCGGGSSAGGGGPKEDVHAAPATLHARTFSSIRRLTPLVREDDHEGGETIDLEAARGELEGGQLAVWAKRGQPRVVLESSALRSSDGASVPADHVHVYLERAMVVEHGSPAGRSGTYVDPLVPAAGRDVVVDGARPLLAWVDVDVPVGLAPDTYVGVVRVRRATKAGRRSGGDAGILARVPVRVSVRGAVIPRVPTLASHVGLDASQVVRFEGVEGGSVELRDTIERYAGLLADSRLSAGDVGALPTGAPTGHAGLAGDQEYLRRVFSRRGVASVRIPFYLDYPFPDPLGQDRPRAVAYLRSAARWARSNGWADRAYVFAIDEPDEADAGAVRELHELVHEADPALRLLVTREASARAFAGSVDIWAPNVSASRFHPEDVARERAAGRDTWWYPSITTWQPYPDLFVDELRPTPRALGWLAWQRDVRGIMYWTATHWQEV
ncbi:MAG: uncharacterized protein JWM98_1106, partial [Thermoleophilia bacterium]|nr:uncharacterized protein [Thermoleophilia bacterium]